MPNIYKTSKPFKKVTLLEESNIKNLFDSGKRLFEICKITGRDKKL